MEPNMPYLAPHRSAALVDEPIDLQVRGLVPGERVHVSADLTDEHGVPWSAGLSFRADAAGDLDLRSAVPEDAGWHGSDPWGLLHALTAPQPRRWTDHLTGSLRPLAVHIQVRRGRRTIAETLLSRHFLAPGVVREQWRDNTIADLFLPSTPRHGPAVLVLAGAWGGFDWCAEVAAVIASRGRPALALAYFDWEGRHGLPTSIEEIPVEYAVRALDRLLRHPAVSPEGAAVLGISKGAEYALLLAAHDARVRALAVHAPTSHVWESVRADGRRPARSSWSLGGKPLPFLAFDADDAFYEAADKTLLLPFHRRALGTVATHRAPSRIPVARIRGDVALFSLREDTLWPATEMGQEVANVIATEGGNQRVRHIQLDATGHAVCLPGLPANGVDGDQWRMGRAEAESWQALVDFLGLAPLGAA
ncbi:acyl-CoA thioesterase/BAAT N-terminal domain-containing protein [Streptomyces sp. AC563]|uniref:acyl-CoA thioesterase/bile acid-CoA:amino acid N-acyltransferase family protein n=1 Tax=Streptomyces buecherae TaxID=2763006 RepID=UPI00164D1687|nr:acyl-CoA thioesterase/bile acid-CoA:amino acid N-acyltransferase family protein [Streptomyces buecherae]MBC3989707.1 acyl-CoA thioesterase/BAAT N-terminal domain-containing protein [Streptomyces buecherae]